MTEHSNITLSQSDFNRHFTAFVTRKVYIKSIGTCLLNHLNYFIWILSEQGINGRNKVAIANIPLYILTKFWRIFFAKQGKTAFRGVVLYLNQSFSIIICKNFISSVMPR